MFLLIYGCSSLISGMFVGELFDLWRIFAVKRIAGCPCLFSCGSGEAAVIRSAGLPVSAPLIQYWHRSQREKIVPPVGAPAKWPWGVCPGPEVARTRLGFMRKIMSVYFTHRISCRQKRRSSRGKWEGGGGGRRKAEDPCLFWVNLSVLKGHFSPRRLVRRSSRSEWPLRGWRSRSDSVDGCWRRGCRAFLLLLLLLEARAPTASRHEPHSLVPVSFQNKGKMLNLSRLMLVELQEEKYCLWERFLKIKVLQVKE